MSTGAVSVACVIVVMVLVLAAIAIAAAFAVASAGTAAFRREPSAKVERDGAARGVGAFARIMECKIQRG